jgi:glycosyltransferase involved in cell wall biosynthesis
MTGIDSRPRLLYDLTGLLHWYGYFRRPAGVQRMIEKIATCPVIQEAATQTSMSCSVEFVVRLVGSDDFLRVDPSLLVALNEDRGQAIKELRRVFAGSLRRAPVSGLLTEGRYFHAPYLLRGLLRSSSPPLAAIKTPGPQDAFFSPGDLWWQRGYATSLGRLKQRTGIRLLQTVHDFYVEERRDWSPAGFSQVFARELRGIAPLVDHWMTSSHAVKRQLTNRLIQWFLPDRPISVLPYGWDTFPPAVRMHPSAERGILARHGVGERPYILFVGTIEPRKNVGALLDAMDSLRAELGERVPDLVIAGGYGWRSGKLRERLRRGRREGRLFWLQNLEDREIAALYRRAHFSVMPSFGEGFGLAIQESLGQGVPCIATSDAAMREAGHDLATYVGLQGDLKGRIARWILDEESLEASRQRIKHRLHLDAFPSWNHAGQLILASAFDGSVELTKATMNH